MKKLISVVLIMSVILIFAGNVSARQLLPSKELAPIPVTDLKSAVDLLEKYVTRQSDHTFALNAPKNVMSAIPDNFIREIYLGMSITNRLIREQNLVTTDDLRIFGARAITSVTMNSMVSGGVNKLVFRWYGWDLYLNNQICHALSTIGGGSVGLTAAILVAAIPAIAPVAGVIAAAVILTIGVISFVNQGNGVIIRMTPTGSIFWISSQ